MGKASHVLGILFFNIIILFLLSLIFAYNNNTSTHIMDTNYPFKKDVLNKTIDTSTISDNIIIKLVQRQDRIVQYLLIILLMLAGLFTTYFLYNVKNIRDDKKEHKEELEKILKNNIERLKEQVTHEINDGLIDKIKNEITENLNRDAMINDIKIAINQKIEEEVRKDVDEIFKNEYNETILNYVNTKVEDVIMNTPESRDMLGSRLRRLNNDMADFFEKNLTDKYEANNLYDIINHSLSDWRVIGQLYSINDDNLALIDALQTITSNPLPEAKQHLEKLKKRYETDMHIYPLIQSAIDSIDTV